MASTKARAGLGRGDTDLFHCWAKLPFSLCDLFKTTQQPVVISGMHALTSLSDTKAPGTVFPTLFSKDVEPSISLGANSRASTLEERGIQGSRESFTPQPFTPLLHVQGLWSLLLFRRFWHPHPQVLLGTYLLSDLLDSRFLYCFDFSTSPIPSCFYIPEITRNCYSTDGNFPVSCLGFKFTVTFTFLLPRH